MERKPGHYTEKRRDSTKATATHQEVEKLHHFIITMRDSSGEFKKRSFTHSMCQNFIQYMSFIPKDNIDVYQKSSNCFH